MGYLVLLNTHKYSKIQKNVPDDDCISSAHLRLEVMLQEERIHLLQNKLDQVKTHTKKCDRLRKKERRFLQTLIEISKRDNVPLSDERCSEFCSKNRVKEVDCKLMCYSSISKTCEDWPNLEKCLKTHPNFNKKNS